MSPGLVIWNTTTHAKKTWNMSTSSLLHLWLSCNCEENRRTLYVRTVAVKRQFYHTLSGKLSHVSHESLVGIEEEAVLRETAS